MSDAVETTESNETPEWLAKLTLPSFWTSLWIFIIFIVLKPVTKETHAQIFGKPLIEGKGGFSEVISNPSLIFILLLLIGQLNRISYSKNPPLPTKPGGGQVFMNWFIINIKLVVLTFLFTFYIIQVVSNNAHNTVIPLKHKGLYTLMFIFIMQSILLNHMFNSTCRNKTVASTGADSGNFECDNLQNSTAVTILTAATSRCLLAPLNFPHYILQKMFGVTCALYFTKKYRCVTFHFYEVSLIRKFSHKCTVLKNLTCKTAFKVLLVYTHWLC